MDLADYLAVIAERSAGDGLGRARLARGQFHDVVLTATTAYRFPRTEAARALLPGRAEVLAALARIGFGFAVPRPLSMVGADQPVGRCYLATTLVPGRPLAADDPRARPATLAAELARVLAGLAGATARLADVVAVAGRRRWCDFAARCETLLFPLMSARGRVRARRELDDVTAPAPRTDPVPVHGDLGGSNLLWRVAAPARLLGVVDWDGLALGSAADDIASIAATYGWTVAADAARRAGHPPAIVGRARRIRETFALQQALPAVLSGDAASLDDGLRDYR